MTTNGRSSARRETPAFTFSRTSFWAALCGQTRTGQKIALPDYDGSGHVSLAEAHASLAWCLFIYDWDWPGAEAEFRRAIECDPSYAPSHQWYAFLLAARGEFMDVRDGRSRSGLVAAH